MRITTKIIVIFLCFTILIAFFIVLNPLLPGTIIVTLPVSWPFLFIFGADETTEKYGVVGELWRIYLSSIPLTALFSIFFAVFAKNIRQLLVLDKKRYTNVR